MVEMRKILWGLFWLACLWCGYWFFGAYTLENGTRAWLDQQRQQGWAADAASVETTGFPLTFETNISDIRLADPHSGVGWKSPALTYSIQAYRLNQVVVDLPNQHRLIAPGQTLDIRSNQMTASLRLRPNTDLALDHAMAQISNLELVSNTGWTSSISQGNLTVTRVDEANASYDIQFDTADWQPGRILKGIIDPQNRLPDVFETVAITARVGFDRPWDRRALERRRPQPKTINLKLADATWGQLSLGLAGDLVINQRGQATGEVTLKARNWRDILNLSVENGILPSNMAGFLEAALEGLSSAAGPANTLDIPITLQEGQMRMGFIPLGAAPLFIIR